MFKIKKCPDYYCWNKSQKKDGKGVFDEFHWYNDTMSFIVNELSVFFPAYNEEGNIKKTVLDAREVLLKIAKKWEIIIVNDGSKDNTAKIASDLLKQDRRIRLITQENSNSIKVKKIFILIIFYRKREKGSF